VWICVGVRRLLYRFSLTGRQFSKPHSIYRGHPKLTQPLRRITANNYIIGQWIFIDNVGGMSSLMDDISPSLRAGGNSVPLVDLNGTLLTPPALVPIPSAAKQHVFIPSPLPICCRFALISRPERNQMILCHPITHRMFSLVTAAN